MQLQISTSLYPDKQIYFLLISVNAGHNKWCCPMILSRFYDLSGSILGHASSPDVQ